MRPVVLTIAGSDSGGGAGIQADLKTMAAHGVFGTSAITAITAQNTVGVQAVHVLPVDVVTAQIVSVMSDLPVAAVKIGMLASADIVRAVHHALDDYTGPVVLDPVMVATSGDRLLSREAEQAIRQLATRATVVTPNLPEAMVLAGSEDVDTIVQWARDHAVTLLLTGGDSPDEGFVADQLITPNAHTVWRGDRISGGPFHGTGCSLSSAVASRLALGNVSLSDACAGAVSWVQGNVREALALGHGSRVLPHTTV